MEKIAGFKCFGCGKLTKVRGDIPEVKEGKIKDREVLCDECVKDKGKVMRFAGMRRLR